MKKHSLKSIGRKANYCAQILAVGALTGGFVGVVVTLYNALAELAEEFARGYYGFFAAHPAFIPLLFAALFLGSVVIGGTLKFLPMLRGTGFAQTEGASRGIFRFRWYEALTGMFAASLFTVFMGLSAGVEGPSAMIGGACGSGVSNLLRRNAIVRQYEITSGACAGLAVALNAPLTGMVFAYEEAHKRFTPEVFVCSFSSVVVAIVIRTLLGPYVGVHTGAFFEGLFLAPETELIFCLYALGAALVVSLAGVAFYFLLFAARKLFAKMTFWKGMGKYMVPFLIAGGAGLVAPYVIGGGVPFIEALGGNMAGLDRVFSSPLAVTLLVIVILKFIATLSVMGSDLPCCASVPMLAIGGGLGALMSLLFQKIGMDPSLSDTLIAVSMVTFFTTVVKAPVTSLIMVVELTRSFTPLLPAVICVAVGYLVGAVFRTEPLYERLLDEMAEKSRKEVKKLTCGVRVTRAAGRAVRDVMWPFTALAVEIVRGEETLVPKGDTELMEGDLVLVEGTPAERETYLGTLAAAVGNVEWTQETLRDMLPAEPPPEETEET